MLAKKKECIELIVVAKKNECIELRQGACIEKARVSTSVGGKLSVLTFRMVLLQHFRKNTK